MTNGHKAAVLLAIEEKLLEAELRLKEARKIYSNYTSSILEVEDDALQGAGTYLTEPECIE